MYYIVLGIASLLFGSQFMAMKAYEKTSGQSLKASVAFSCLAGAFSAVIFLVVGKFRLSFSLFSFVIASLSALGGVAGNIIGIKTLSMGDIAVYSLFLMLGGMMVPYVYGVLFLKEHIGVWNGIGLVLLTAALVLPVYERKKEKKKGNALFYVFCCVLFLLNGGLSTLAKIHQIGAQAVPTLDFTVLIYGMQTLFALPTWGIVALVSRKKQAGMPRIPVPDDTTTVADTVPAARSNKKIPIALLCALVYAALNGSATFLNNTGAKHLPASAQFPIITGGTLVFSALLGWLIYKEKPTRMQFVRLVVAVTATVLFIL